MTEQHLRPDPGDSALSSDVEQAKPAAATIPWENRDELGWITAAAATTQLFLLHPLRAFASTRPRGGFRGPLLFALVVTALASFLGELVDGIVRLTLELDGSGNMSDILDLTVNDQRVPGVAWFPGAALGLAGLGGCVLGLVVGIPVFAVMFPLVILVWAGILHLCLKLVGGLRESVAGYQGTWAGVCYATIGFVPGMLPMVGDWVAFVWLGVMQGIGFWRLHRTTPIRAAAALLLPLVIVAVLWVLKAMGVLPIEPGGGP